MVDGTKRIAKQREEKQASKVARAGDEDHLPDNDDNTRTNTSTDSEREEELD